jgi:hypothetical protein
LPSRKHDPLNITYVVNYPPQSGEKTSVSYPRAGVHDELWNNPIGWQPVLKGAFNPASALVESAPELPKRAPMKRQRFDPSDPCASSGERAVLMGTTHGLSANGFAAVARCCSWPDAADRAEALSYVMCRLVAVGAAVQSLRGRKLQSEV